MTTKLFSGIAKWAKVRKPDEVYKNYSIDVYLTPASWTEFDLSGLQLKKRTSEDGDYITFRRKEAEYNFAKKAEQVNGPPLVYIKDAQSGEFIQSKDTLIGNGSEVTVAIEVYKTKNGMAHRLVRVFVDKLVEYNAQAAAPEQAKLPF